MKKPIFLILIGIGVSLLLVGAAFVVPWFVKMYNEMEESMAQHRQYIRALEASARQPLTVVQEELLSQLLAGTREIVASQNPNDLEKVLSSEPYLAHLKGMEDETYENFPAYIAAMPTTNMRTIARSRITATLGSDKENAELEIWTNYYFKVRAWGTTVEAPQDNMKELNELHQTYLIAPLMEEDVEASGLHSQIVHIGMSSLFMTEHNNVFKEVWREKLETHGVWQGLLWCAIGDPGEFALMRSFFTDMTTFQAWILKPPVTEE